MRLAIVLLAGGLTIGVAPLGAAQETVADDPDQVTGTTDPAPDVPDPAQAGPKLDKEIPLRQFLVLPPVGKYSRDPLHQDPIDAALACGAWKPPRAGDEITSTSGEKFRWRVGVADPQGRLRGPASGGGYAYVNVSQPVERVMMLEATGHVAVCVNGDWLAGDLYGYGRPHLPVLLKAGPNSLLFHVAQPNFKARLVEPSAEIAILADDATLPDLVIGESGRPWAAVPIVNATKRRLIGGQLRVTIGENTISTRLPPIEPLTLFKAPLRLDPSAAEGGSAVMRVALHLPRRGGSSPSPDPTAGAQLNLRRVPSTEPHVCTFLSGIDGSVQAYSVAPATGSTSDGKTGMIVALHGIGDDHASFAKNFKPKPWAHVVVPQNRRPFGFDWVDWGGDDALEALADARRHLKQDPGRTYVTGHGVGGYGAWRLALRFPDRFAAVGPSAGRVTFSKAPTTADSSPEPPLATLFRRGAAARESAPLLRNTTNLGVYLLHGSEDQRVPTAQSRYLRGRLGEFHPDFVYYERPGAGHWWGPECVDWPGMTEFFRQRRLPDLRDVKQVDFTTHHPSLAAEAHWATIETQEQPLRPSRVVIDHDYRKRTFRGRTENVDRLSLDVSHLPSGSEVTIRLDGSASLTAKRPSLARRIWLAKNEDDQWETISRPRPSLKSPRRAGLLKSAFDNRVLLVYGTQGDQEENRWAAAKARYDAQSFWRRGNGAFQVLPDSEFIAARQPNRSVILYGNAETNSAWPALLSTSPVQVRGDRVEIGSGTNVRPEMGDNLGVLMVRPRPGSTTASVAVVGGTGLAGMRLTDRLRYFVSGVTYPDVMVFGPGVLTEGVPDVRAAGHFGSDWQVGSGEIVWRDLAL